MPLDLPMRKIDYIEGCRAEIVLTDGSKIVGYGDCVSDGPIDEDSEEFEEFLLFEMDDGDYMFLQDCDIKSYKLLD